jgi:hypothetical protein
MKRLFALALAIALSLALAAPAAAADPWRPFKGGGTTADTITGPEGCPEGAGWRYSSAGSVTVTHLGLVRVEVSHCSWMDGHFGPGVLTMTAANGDQLVFEDWGTFEIGMPVEGMTSYIDLHLELVRGTGRFENARADISGLGWGVIGSNVTTMRYSGEISY